MDKKIILTIKELFEIISIAYEDGFKYCIEKERIFKKYGHSQEKDVIGYTKKKIKEVEEFVV